MFGAFVAVKVFSLKHSKDLNASAWHTAWASGIPLGMRQAAMLIFESSRRECGRQQTYRKAREGEGNLDGVEAQSIQDLHDGGEVDRGCQWGGASW